MEKIVSLSIICKDIKVHKVKRNLYNSVTVCGKISYISKGDVQVNVIQYACQNDGIFVPAYFKSSKITIIVQCLYDIRATSDEHHGV